MHLLMSGVNSDDIEHHDVIKNVSSQSYCDSHTSVILQAQKTGVGGGVASCSIALAFYRCSAFKCMPTND